MRSLAKAMVYEALLGLKTWVCIMLLKFIVAIV